MSPRASQHEKDYTSIICDLKKVLNKPVRQFKSSNWFNGGRRKR